MKINTAADLAAVLDPEREVQGWWKLAPTKCGNGTTDGVIDIYIGPPDLHTAREHAWRMEDYILKNNVCDYMPNTINMMEGSTSVFLGESILRSTNHSAALVAAIERGGG